MGIERTVRAVAEAAAGYLSGSKPFAVVSVDNENRATFVGAYKSRLIANGIATRSMGDHVDGWVRAYVAARNNRGAIIVLTGRVVVGKYTPCGECAS
jgi:hypothetical protein